MTEQLQSHTEPMQRNLFTIGHSLRSGWEFIELLRAHGITALCDVRSVPISNRNPVFRRDVLKKGLRRYGITYVHMPELGGRNRDPSLYKEGKVDYTLLAETPRFRKGLARLVEGVERHRIALMCAEKDPIACHRAILITRCLRGTDLQIAHIIGPGKLETNEEMERRLVRAVGLPEEDFFMTAGHLVEQAYAIQGERIAYTRMRLEVRQLDRMSSKPNSA